MDESRGHTGTEAGRVAVPIAGPLVEARFARRPNRFVVHARLEDGSEAVAHLPDPGRLEELLVPDRRIWLRPADDPARKTSWTAVLVQTPEDDGLVSVDTTLPNRLVERALATGALEEFAGWKIDRSEVTVGGSRFDFRLVPDPEATSPAPSDPGDSDHEAHDTGAPDPDAPTFAAPDSRAPDPAAHDELYLEVKSVTLVEDGVGLFPDAVTARGARHVRELTELIGRDGTGAAVLFVVQRADVRRVLAAPSIDPTFAEALAEARERGVRVLARRCRVTTNEVILGDRVPAE